MKKCLSLVLVLCIILASIPVLAEETEIRNNGTFNYVLQGDRILIKGLTEDKFLAPERTVSNYEREDYTRTVTIPREIGGALVELEKEAFRGVESVGTIIFEEGITEIPLGLCREMPNLKKVVLPKSLKKIGWSAFYDCQKLSTINLPENLEIIDEYAFANCKSIEKVILPEGIKTIGNSAFGSTNIKTLEMPSSVVELGNYTFSRCENLTFVNLNNVEILRQGTFSNCTRLKKVVHNGKLTQLGSFAFENCYELEDIDVKCVKKFDTAVFRGTEKLKYLNLQGIEEAWTVEDRYVVEGEKPYFKGETYQQTKGIIRSPLASSSFSQMNGLEMVRINTKNLKTISEARGVLFFDTPKLKNIIFENFTPALTGKWLCCQYDLKKPRNEGLTLYGNSDVKEYAESIGVMYKELIDAQIDGEYTAIDETKASDFTYIIQNDTVYLTGYTGDGGDVVIPSAIDGYEVKTIWTDTFKNCDNVRKITIPDTVTAIAGRAFSGCDNIEELVLPDSIKWINEYTFTGCVIKKLVLGKGITYVPANGFSGCKIERMVVLNPGTKMHNTYRYDVITHGRVLDYIMPGSFMYCNIGEIVAQKGSVAESYAKEMNIKFVPIEDFKEDNSIEVEPKIQSIYGGEVFRGYFADRITKIAESMGGIVNISGDNIVVTKNGKSLLITGDVVHYKQNGRVVTENLYCYPWSIKMPEKALESVLGTDNRKSEKYKEFFRTYNGGVNSIEGTIETPYGSVAKIYPGGTMPGYAHYLTFVKWNGESVNLTKDAPYTNVYTQAKWEKIELSEDGKILTVTYPENKKKLTFSQSPNSPERVLWDEGTYVITANLETGEVNRVIKPLKEEGTKEMAQTKPPVTEWVEPAKTIEKDGKVWQADSDKKVVMEDVTGFEYQDGVIYMKTADGIVYERLNNGSNKIQPTDKEIKFEDLIEKDISIFVDRTKVGTDIAPYIKNNRVMVPMRAIFEALGASVRWNNSTRTVISKKGNVEVKITIGENVLYKNGEAIELDCAAEITNDRTMVPVRAISEAFDYLVEWNNETKRVEIVASYNRTYYVYDEDGQITGAKDGEDNYLNYEYLYDESGNVVRVWEKTIIKNSDRLFEYTYNEKGQRVSKGVCRDWWMDALCGGPIDKEVIFTEVEKYFYDEAGKIAYSESPDGTRTNYIYDEKGKLSRKESENGKVLAKYFYDEDGVLSYKEEY